MATTKKVKNKARRSRKALPKIVKASNVKRPVKQPRSRTLARATVKAEKVVAGRKASADNRARVAAEKARKAAHNG
jgi:hypothetical protein